MADEEYSSAEDPALKAEIARLEKLVKEGEQAAALLHNKQEIARKLRAKRVQVSHEGGGGYGSHWDDGTEQVSIDGVKVGPVFDGGGRWLGGDKPKGDILVAGGPAQISPIRSISHWLRITLANDEIEIVVKKG